MPTSALHLKNAAQISVAASNRLNESWLSSAVRGGFAGGDDAIAHTTVPRGDRASKVKFTVSPLNRESLNDAVTSREQRAKLIV